jgi:hypothetical protein
MGEKTVLLVEDNPDDEALTLNAFDKGALPYLMVAMRGVADGQPNDYRPGAHSYRRRSIDFNPISGGIAMLIGYCPMLNENVR